MRQVTPPAAKVTHNKHDCPSSCTYWPLLTVSSTLFRLTRKPLSHEWVRHCIAYGDITEWRNTHNWNNFDFVKLLSCKLCLIREVVRLNVLYVHVHHGRRKFPACWTFKGNRSSTNLPFIQQCRISAAFDECITFVMFVVSSFPAFDKKGICHKKWRLLKRLLNDLEGI